MLYTGHSKTVEYFCSHTSLVDLSLTSRLHGNDFSLVKMLLYSSNVIFCFRKLIFGLGTPLQLDRESIIVGVFAKMQYDLPSNATDFTEPGVYYTRASRSRWSFYKIFEKMIAMYGFGGKECLLRAICEVSYVPFDVNHGLLGQLVQTFLR